MTYNGPLYDYLVVVDFEATCDEGENPQVTRANQEIIEFPWYGFSVCRVVVNVMTRVVVDTIHGQMVDSRQIYVKPEWSKSLTPFCTQLTGITNEMLANAGTLRDAVQQVGVGSFMNSII
jgi:inhibitor of KinA sporulation pathway (predicted exonuclease)